MSRHAGRLAAFLLISATLAAGPLAPRALAEAPEHSQAAEPSQDEAPAATLTQEPPTASQTDEAAGQSLIPMAPTPLADPTAPLLTGSTAVQAGHMDVSRVAEPGYLEGAEATYADGVLRVTRQDQPVALTGSSSSLRVVCAAGVRLSLQSLALSTTEEHPLISWEQPTGASVTFSGTCHLENAAGGCLSSPGDLAISPVDPDTDSLSLSSGGVCVEADGTAWLQGALSLNGNVGVQAGFAHLGSGPDGTSIQLVAQSDGIQAAGDVHLEGVANILAGQSAVQAAGSVTVSNAFMNLSASTIGVQAGGDIILASSTVFTGPLLNLQGSAASLDGEMALQGAYEISDLDPYAAYTIQEARSTWGSGRELTDVHPSPEGTIRYYTLGSAGIEGRRYTVSVDEATHTIAFESLSQAYVIDLGKVLLQSSRLPDGVTLELDQASQTPPTLRIANPEAQITLTGDGGGISVRVEAAQSITLSSASLEASSASALVFDMPGEADLVLRESSSIRADAGQSAIAVGATSLHVVQSGGAGMLSISGEGHGIAPLRADVSQDLFMESGELDVSTAGNALVLAGTLSVSGGMASLESTGAPNAVEVSALRVRGGRLSVAGRAEGAVGLRAARADLSGGVTCATGSQIGLLAGTISQQNCALNTQTLLDGGYGLQVEGTEGSVLESRVLVANALRPTGLSGAMMTEGQHLIGSLSPGGTYELRDETQVQPVSLGTVRASGNGEVAYYTSESGIYALVFGNQITLVNESAYVERTLTDPETGISVFGTIPFTAQLSVTPLEGGELDAVRQAAGRHEIAFPVNIRLLQEGQDASFEGELTISFPMGEDWNGQTLNVIHILPRLAGAQELERIPAEVEDGTLSIRCATLSPFAVQLPTLVEQTEAPTPVPEAEPVMSMEVFWILVALCAGMAVWGAVVLRKHMRRKREDGEADPRQDDGKGGA